MSRIRLLKAMSLILLVFVSVDVDAGVLSELSKAGIRAIKKRCIECRLGSSLSNKIRNRNAPSLEDIMRRDEDDYLSVIKLQKPRFHEKALNALREFKPRTLRGRRNSISDQEAEKLFARIENHRVVGKCNQKKYDPVGVIGFCFGRGAAFSLEALKEGVNKDSIKKVWAVGDFVAPDGGKWIYHTATIIRGSGGKWLAFDTDLFTKPVRVETWHKAMRERATQDFNLHISSLKRTSPVTSAPHYGDSKEKAIRQYYKDYLDDFRPRVRGASN